jgi:hypothetical protein
VSCYIEPGNGDKLVDIWGKIATVEGVVTRDPETGRALAVRHITDIHLVEDEGQRDGYIRARGALPRRAGDPRAEEVAYATAERDARELDAETEREIDRLWDPASPIGSWSITVSSGTRPVT